jgi:hypothetical protein
MTTATSSANGIQMSKPQLDMLGTPMMPKTPLNL